MCLPNRKSNIVFFLYEETAKAFTSVNAYNAFYDLKYTW